MLRLLALGCASHMARAQFGLHEFDALYGYQLNSQHDTAQLPVNYPYMTEGRRAGDGFSSNSPYTATDPSFPYYDDWTRQKNVLQIERENAEERKEHRLHMLQDAGLQARVNEQHDDQFYRNRDFRQFKHVGEVSRQWEYNTAGGWGPALDTGETRWEGSWKGDRNWESVNHGNLTMATFVVQAAEQWNPSNTMLIKGGKYKVYVPEKRHGISQRWNDTRITVSADGYDSHYDAVSKCHVALGQCRSYLRQRRRAPKSNWMKLMCGIGNYVWQLSSVGENKNRMMRLREDDFVDTIFPVGRTLTFTAQHTGELICFANDAPGLYWNNKDNLTVVVECQGPCKQIQACNDNQGCIDRSVLPVKPPPSTCFNYTWIIPLENNTNKTNLTGTTGTWPSNERHLNCSNGTHWGEYMYRENATGFKTVHDLAGNISDAYTSNASNCSAIYPTDTAVVCCNTSSSIVGDDWHHNTTMWQLMDNSSVFTHTAMIVMHNGTHAYIQPRNETVKCSVVLQAAVAANRTNNGSNSSNSSR